MTAAKGARINARVTPEIARKLALLRRETGKSTTEILLSAVDRYYAEVTRGSGSPARILSDSGFVGCAEGVRTLSQTYKQELTRSLGKKA